jgi:hypothetical protein
VQNAAEEEFDATAQVHHVVNVRGIKFPTSVITRPGGRGLCHPKSTQVVSASFFINERG